MNRILIALLLAIPLATAQTDVTFATPALTMGATEATGSSSGYLVGDNMDGLTIEAARGYYVTTVIAWGISNGDVLSYADSAQISETRSTDLTGLSLSLSGADWGIAMAASGATTSKSLHIDQPISGTVGWGVGTTGGPLPHPLVRSIAAAERSGALLELHDMVGWHLMGDLDLEIHGLSGTLAHDGGAAEIRSGRIDSHSMPGDVHVQRHRYVALHLDDATMTWAGAGQGFGRLAMDNPSLDINGSIALPDVQGLPDHAIAPDGTWQGTGEFRLELLGPAPDGRVAARMDAAPERLNVDGQAIPLAQASAVVAPALAAVVAGLLAKLAYGSALFTRLPADEALKHPRRRALVEYIQAHPGATFRELCRETQIPTGTCRHHLSVLQRSQVIVEHGHRSTTRFFENHGKFDQTWEKVVMLREPELAQLHDFVEAHPGAMQKQILDHAGTTWGWSRSTTQHRLSRLVDNGVVMFREIGRRKEYSVADAPPAPSMYQPRLT